MTLQNSSLLSSLWLSAFYQDGYTLLKLLLSFFLFANIREDAQIIDINIYPFFFVEKVRYKHFSFRFAFS